MRKVGKFGDVRARLVELGMPADEDTVRAVEGILEDVARVIRPLESIDSGETVPAILSEHSSCMKSRLPTDHTDHTY